MNFPTPEGKQMLEAIAKASGSNPMAFQPVQSNTAVAVDAEAQKRFQGEGQKPAAPGGLTPPGGSTGPSVAQPKTRDVIGENLPSGDWTRKLGSYQAIPMDQRQGRNAQTAIQNILRQQQDLAKDQGLDPGYAAKRAEQLSADLEELRRMVAQLQGTGVRRDTNLQGNAELQRKY